MSNVWKNTGKLKPGNWKEHVNPKDMSLEDALDALGDAKELKKFWTQMEGFLKEIVKSKMPEGEMEYVGHHFQVVLNERVRAGGLNKELIIEEMGEEWVEEHTNEPTEYLELRLNRLDPEEVE